MKQISVKIHNTLFYSIKILLPYAVCIFLHVHNLRDQLYRVNHSAVSAYLFTQFFGIHHQQHQQLSGTTARTRTTTKGDRQHLH